MKDINLLFLAPHWRVALVRQFAESWKQNQAPGRLIGADSDPDAGTLKILPWAHAIPMFTDNTCKDALLDICKQESVDAIIPLTNKAIDFLDENRNTFESGKIHLYIAPSEAVTLCHDKLKFAEHFKEGPVKVPKTWLSGEVPEDAPFPLIGKSRHGEGSQNVVQVDTPEELAFYASKFPGHVFQEKIEGTEYSIDWFSDQMGIPQVVVPRERMAVRAGEVMKSRIHLAPDLVAVAKKIGTALKLTGTATLQGILGADNQFWFTDINLRCGSGYVHTISAGADVPLMIHRELCNVSIDDISCDIKDQSVLVRYTDHLPL